MEQKAIIFVFVVVCFMGPQLFAQSCDLNSTENRRIQINSISKPYSAIVQMTMHRGKSYQGTAFFIHPRVLLTAGHNLRRRPQIFFTRVKSITLRAGATSETNFLSKKQYTTTQNENIYTLESFNKDYSIYEDFGIIILPDNELFDQVGHHFTLVTYDAHLLNGAAVHTAGYPGDKDFCTLWADSTKNFFPFINTVSNPNNVEYLKYDFSTETGASGSPVWINLDGKNKVFAIHTYGNDNDDAICIQ
jgi:V8-like Glu-specific endopeptidase